MVRPGLFFRRTGCSLPGFPEVCDSRESVPPSPMVPAPALYGHGLATRSGRGRRPMPAIGESAGRKWGQRPIAPEAGCDEAVGVSAYERGGTMTRGTVVCGVTETPDGRGAAELAGALGTRLGLRL